MNIDEFARKVQLAVSAALQKEVLIWETLKPNGIKLHGIVVLESDINISIVIYLEPHLEKYNDTQNFTKTIDSILTLYHRHKQTEPFDLSRIRDFCQVRHKLYCRLINYEANQELLQTVPHSKFLDLAEVFYTDFQINGYTGSAIVCNEDLEHWGISGSELKQIAEENTLCLYPFSISSLHGPIPSGELPSKTSSGLLPESSVPMFVLSNKERSYGATALCYEKILDNFSQSIGSDLIVLPSSVHEVILLPLNAGIHIDCLRAIVYDTNRTKIHPSEFLSDSVYLYSRKNKQLAIA